MVTAKGNARVIQTEHQLQLALCKYIRSQYPKVIFASDYAAGIKLDRFKAAMQKMFKSGRGYPDLFIALPVQRIDALAWYHGLYLELKREGTKLKRDKDGTKILAGDYKKRVAGDWWDIHIEEQAQLLSTLDDLGYCAKFAVGFDEAKSIIDWYVRGANGQVPQPRLSSSLTGKGDDELPF